MDTNDFLGSTPVYQLFVSLNGAHIILFWMNDSNTFKILKSGTLGSNSNIKAVLTLDFSITNMDVYNVFDEFVHIQYTSRDLLMVPLSSNYKVTVVDMVLPNKDMSYVMLKETSYWP